MKQVSLRFFHFAVASFLFSISVFSQAKLVQEVTASGNELVIPYKKFILPNGLTLLVHEDDSDPIVHVDVTYHVGSARELVGRSGFAHFFEHMMFQGSEHVRDEEHFKIVTEAGGTLNGTTNLDRTNYFETMPSNYLETALWLEADRMGWFLDSVTQQKFEIQRATVKNERGQNYDNRPYGLVYEKTIEALYPFGHPYSWTTIGYIEDLNAATLDDLKRFFLRWYGPNNATLTVAGNVKTDEVVRLVEKYFGNIPRGQEVKNMAPQPAKLDQDRYISYEDNIRFPMIRITFPGVEARHKDEAALDVLANILGGGNNSVLYQHFVKTQKAIQATATNPANELAGEFVITVLPYPGTSLADIEKEIRQLLADFEKRGITDDDLNRFKAQHEADEIRALQSVSGKASKLAYYQTFTGNPNYLKQDLDRYKAVTKEDVMRVFNTYVKNKPAVILSVVPKGKSELVARPDNYKRPEVPAGFKNDLSEYENLKYNKGQYPFDLSYRPQPGPNPVIKLPDYWTTEFENGLKLIATEYDELPVIAMRISLDGGKLLDGMDKVGLAYLTAELMNEGTKNYTAEQLSLNLELLGSDIDVSASSEGIEISVFSLKKNFDKTLEYLKEIMFSPRFDEADFERLKKEQLEAIANQKNQASTIANNVLNRVMYGDESIYGIPTIGTEKTVSSITLDDVKKYYQQFFSPATASVVLVGNVGKKDVLKKLEFLKTWKGNAVKLPAFAAPKGVNKTTLYFVDKPGAAQSEIRVGLPGLAWDATGDYFRAGIMNYPFGGAFNSRLNLNLREKRGYTYGVRSYFNGSKFTGTFVVSGGFLAHATDSVVMEIMNELTNYKENGVTEQELVFTKNSIGQRDALKYETPLQKAGFMTNIITYNLDKNFVKTQNEILKKLTSFDINQLSKQLFKLDKLAIVVVGDKKKVFDKLQLLGIPVVELDFNGNKL
jgi:zinc protease